jgi:hypothetical protein
MSKYHAMDPSPSTCILNIVIVIISGSLGRYQSVAKSSHGVHICHIMDKKSQCLDTSGRLSALYGEQELTIENGSLEARLNKWILKIEK